MKQLSSITFWLFVCVCASSEAFAQRKAVSGAEVTGTFRSYLTGRFRDSYNEILIQALGGNKLKVEMKLVQPYQVTENISFNVGYGTGEAVILGDKAVFTPEDGAESCKITLEFSKPGTLIVSTEDGERCGFGNRVSATGTYKKTSGAKPKFGDSTSYGYVEPRKAVSGAEVTGTFEHYAKDNSKTVHNEISIQALGGNKLKIEMSLLYMAAPPVETDARDGFASGAAVIEGDTAYFTPDGASSCEIMLEFIKPGTLRVTQRGASLDCGFPPLVWATGTYRKTSGAKPKFGVSPLQTK